MKALTWTGVNQLSVEDVAEPTLLNGHDVIVKVRRTTTCGSDLHLLSGYIPFMRAGDVIGHEFMGEIVEVGPAVRHRAVGDRVVVSSFVACGSCWYCAQELYSLCDNANPNPGITEGLWGQAIGGCLGYSHAVGGYAGSHAEYIRVPYGDGSTFVVPDGVSDDRALFASDAAPTAFTGVDLAGVRPGDTVAVWGAGGVGQLAARISELVGAERVVVIDRLPDRLQQVREVIGAETIDYTSTDVAAELRELTGGRGPDVCIEAVGMEAHSPGPQGVYDQVKQQLRLQTDRPTAVREAIMSCRKGGSVFVLGVFAEMVDKFPLGALMNKSLRFGGAQVHGPRYIPRILEHMAAGALVTEHLATHVMPLDEAPHGYELFKEKQDGCVRAVFTPNG
ncbi:zinc-dependent alcohol dehydrogenase [Blastococcus tunisiensis]|uniref:Threonine dehydrogenase n=1 Tax=Blastococcus tunisiensis TaxID=1798228 RepID=A0A1I2K186_9ACTN|nr:zinc-dependent alcohol dehydrogenase [Blastococcus sp. DSM 46838]SFF58786.1 Threonine dehydrogenase [Blastococcus sp. DSM 46838]